jgi:hypothetical protein
MVFQDIEQLEMNDRSSHENHSLNANYYMEFEWRQIHRKETLTRSNLIREFLHSKKPFSMLENVVYNQVCSVSQEQDELNLLDGFSDVRQFVV